MPSPSDHLLSPTGLRAQPEQLGFVARRRIQVLNDRSDEVRTANENLGSTSRVTTTWLPEYTSFRPVPRPASERMTTSESHVVVSPHPRRASPAEKTLSPLQRRIHSPDVSSPNRAATAPQVRHKQINTDDVALTSTSQLSSQVSTDLSYTAINSPPGTPSRSAKTKNPAPPSDVPSPAARAVREAWASPTGSPRNKFIRNSNGTPTHMEALQPVPPPPRSLNSATSRPVGEYRRPRPRSSSRSMASPDTFARPVNQELRLNDEMRLNDTRLPHNSPRHSSRGFTAVSTSPQHLVPRSPNESVLSHAPTFPSHSAGRESSGHRATKPRWETHMDKMGWCWDTQVQEPSVGHIRPHTSELLRPPTGPSRVRLGTYSNVPHLLKSNKASAHRIKRLVENVKWWHQNMAYDERSNSFRVPTADVFSAQRPHVTYDPLV